MDVRYLKSLISVVDCGSIADAARHEGLTAAAISQRIQVLERKFGFELLSRVGNSAKATNECMRLLPRARRIVREVSLLNGDVDEDGLTGTLRIGAISTVLTGILPPALMSLARRAPNIQPAIVPGTSRSLYRALLAGELDAAILVAPPFEIPKTLKSISLEREELLFLSPENLGGDFKELLSSQPYIRYDPAAWGGRQAQLFLDEQGIVPTLLCDLDALETIVMLVESGMGVSLVPHWNGLKKLLARSVVTPISDSRYERHILFLSRVEEDRLNMLKALQEILLEN
ncbi:LysR substrate-binding domain-containing protein [Herbaspirillum lusitanum]|uniref:LysR substrate-binding domain-containing protein n=1 Tax=Herbaspirillum lusitanum TaxID=213312 RepID=UPI000494226A|nr:LysR substrate-binding domain-containing protein [Herbaspirillum lusitanum]